MNVLEIKGGIGGWYADAAYLDYRLNQFDNQDVEVHIDSLGGSFVDAISMYHSLKKYKGKTVAVYTGLCASAATIVAAGCDTIKMTDASAILIHKVLNWVDVYGYLNSDDIEKAIEDLKKTQKELDTLSSLAASIYAKKAGKSIEEMLSIMKEDSWILAEVAKEYGLVDDIIETQESKKAEQKIEDLIENNRQTALMNNVVLPKFQKQTKTNKNNMANTLLDKVKNFFNTNGLDTSKAESLINELGLDTDYKSELENVKNELAIVKNRKIEDEITNAIAEKTAGLTAVIENIKIGNETFLNQLKSEISNSVEKTIAEKVNAKVAAIHLGLTNKIKDGDLNGNPSFVEPQNTIENPFAALDKMFPAKK
jgi:ATP-dependent Clp protease, protease subunit